MIAFTRRIPTHPERKQNEKQQNNDGMETEQCKKAIPQSTIQLSIIQ